MASTLLLFVAFRKNVKQPTLLPGCYWNEREIGLKPPFLDTENRINSPFPVMAPFPASSQQI